MSKVTFEEVLKKEKQSKLQQIKLVLTLSLPAILAQLTSIAMQYIDAGMVGNLGEDATASIGLVSTSIWLIGGMCSGLVSGFSVQVAQLFGADRADRARDVFRQSIKCLIGISIIISVIGISISGYLPVWLNGDVEIRESASRYFLIYCASIPAIMLRQLSAGMMQCSGDMKTPSFLMGLLCVLDVIFNMIFIYGLNMGVTGAAIGTACSDILIAIVMFVAVAVRSPKLTLKIKGSWSIKKDTILNAIKIGVPMTLDHVFMCSAYVVGTVLVAPLGKTALAANTLAITVESLCYMPGYGIGSASTVIIGQSTGAGRKDLTKTFSRLGVLLGMLLMSATAVLIYFMLPFIFGHMTNEALVAELGIKILSIELLAEPFYAASICANGAFRGAGDTLVPAIMNLVSMWGVRILLSIFLVPSYGLIGYWIAMAVELTFRGLIFIVRLLSGRWMKKSVC